MSKELRPMRGSIAERDKLVFPYMATPKYDGVRCFIHNKVAYTKSGKPFANKYIQRLAKQLANGLDGELICGDPLDPKCFRRTTAKTRRERGIPSKLKFFVFDVIPSSTQRYDADDRYRRVVEHIVHYRKMTVEESVGRRKGYGHGTILRPYNRVIAAPMLIVRNIAELDAYEAELLAQGYEGVMLRSPTSPYKHGQATVNENYLLKLKRFSDGEAEILDFVEFNHNDNVAFRDEQGFTKRSSSKSGKRPGNKLGKFIVRALNGPFQGKTFEVGTGYTDDERRSIWSSRETYRGKTLTFRCQTFTGGYDLPRIPTFVGFRDKSDMSVDDA